MKEINLFLMDITNSENTNGVDRYLKTLVKSLVKTQKIKIHWFSFEKNEERLFIRTKIENGYTRTFIPIPQIFSEIISKKYWMKKFNQYLLFLLKDKFEGLENILIHLHTLNLIDFALEVKHKYNARIITHLHCIPWKNVYNVDQQRFNNLYQQYYNSNSFIPQLYLSNNSEFDSYTKADKIICVTQCAKEFLSKFKIEPSKIDYIPNGIEDFNNCEVVKTTNKTPILLYAGILSKSKGIEYILEALEIVKREGHEFEFRIAGSVDEHMKWNLKQKYSEINFKLLGRLSFEDLSKEYKKANIGLIASLQEQASYVALEMAMFGLPIITTAVDGLDEIFTHKLNSLKVNTNFHKLKGLNIDIETYAESIIKLLSNKKLGMKLSSNSRQLFKDHLTVNKMQEETLKTYNNTLKL